MKRFPPSVAGPARASRLRGLLTGLLAALVAACGDAPASSPRWVDLARDFEPRALADVARTWADGRTRVRPHGEERHQVWVEATLEGADWREEGGPGLHSTDRPRGGGFRHVPDGPMRLATAEHEFVRAVPEEGPRPGTFHVDAERIYLALAEGEPVPERVTFGIRAASGASFDRTWRLRTYDRVASGIPVWAGGREEVACDVPPDSRLVLVTLHQGPPAVPGEASSPAAFRVRLDGETILEHEQRGGEAWHSLVLPADGLVRATLSFEVEGTGLGLFCTPTLAPARAGSYSARPWQGGRPDIVLLVADTFRADNMATYGGAPDTTPELDALAGRSVRFLRARAPAAWTLPSTSSLFTGLFPGQHGATREGLALSREFTTVAEVLRQNGYRTAAVTDSGFVSPAFGMDQGFDWFAEHHVNDWSLDETLERAQEAIARDDGRPLFLLVHSYRAHGPYRRGAEEDDSDWNDLVAEGFARLRERDPSDRDAKLELLLEAADRMRELYLDGVRDLDEKLGRFVDALDENELLADGYLIFTSDHGEAFGENRDVWHGRRLWETKLRIPLLLAGGGLEPRDVDWPVTLVDVAPTLAELAGLPHEPGWVGTSLLSVDGARPTFSFRLEHLRELAIIDEGRKVLADPDPDALRRGEYAAAFDLGRDPGEEHDLAPTEAEWPAELCREMADAVELFLAPRGEAVELSLDPETRRRLADIGYGGDG